tara:strand:- start:371 stop:511 length:141 start_codon:yes stop_codon:yes gene_type:complete
MNGNKTAYWANNTEGRIQMLNNSTNLELELMKLIIEDLLKQRREEE